jgi:hypothetical protein
MQMNELNRVIGRAMRQVQLSSGPRRDTMRHVVICLNRAKWMLLDGNEAAARVWVASARLRVLQARMIRAA